MATRRNTGAASPPSDGVSEASGDSTPDAPKDAPESTPETKAKEPKTPYRVGSKNALSTLGGLKGPNEGIVLSDLSRDPKEAQKRANDLCEKKKLVKN